MTRTPFGRSLGLGLLAILVLAMTCGSSAGASRQDLDGFLAKIQDANGDVRRAAWENAGKLGADAISPLGKLLGGENRPVAKAAERALEVVAHYASRPGADAERKAVSAALIELTRQGNPVKVRDKALRLLGSTGQDDSVPAIAALLGDKEVWEAARWALERIPGKASNVALIRALYKAPSWQKSELLKFQEAIISTLGAKKAPEAVEPLLGFVQSGQRSLRIAAVEALGRIGDARAAEPILDVARTASGREKAIAHDNYLRIADKLLEKRRPQAALEMYFNALRATADVAAGGAVLVGLGKVGGDAAIRVLFEALLAPSPGIRNAAISALTNLKGREAGAAIAALLPRAQPELKPILLRILVDRKDPFASGALISAARDPDAEFRLTALELIGEIVDDNLAISLVTALEKEGPEGKRAALRSYLKYADWVLRKGNWRSALGIYYNALDCAMDDAERRTALQGIGAIASKDSTLLVEKMMDNPSLRDDAARAYIAIASNKANWTDKRAPIWMLTKVVDSPCSVEVIQLAASRLKEFGVIIPIAERSGFVTRWWLVGPFPNPGNSAYEKEFPPEKEVDLGKGVQYDGKTFAWKKVITVNPQGRVNLEEEFDPNQNVAAYAYTEIKSPNEAKVKFKIGSDDSAVCWLNGEKIHAVKVSRGLSVDQDVVNATLRAGINRILMKILNEGAQWEFCLRITDDQDKPIDMSKVER